MLVSSRIATGTYIKLADSLYKLLVEEALSSGDEAALSAKELEISLNRLPEYSRKRTMTHEAMLYIASITAFEGNKNGLVVAIE
tara:strand:+ start:273 stop:524 length:252 start_codon:yes stop_codon:yes gene_type:complete